MESDRQTHSPNKALIGLIVVVVLVAVTTAVIVFANGDKDDKSSSAGTSASVSPAVSSTVSAASLKDGTYTATGSYQTPGGQESIGVTVTLSGGTVTDASVQQEGKTGEAQDYQAAFASGFKSQVVGKKITDISLTRVAGSSLTPGGFNKALSAIEQQAQS